MPDLVARLAGLHTTLTTRLTLQDSLHSLSGRLDMVISQIELRSSGAPAPLPLTVKRKGKGKAKLPQANSAKPISKYVEGESEDEEPELAGMDVEVESAEEEGSLEDVELGGSEEDEDDAETSEDEVETDENEEEDVEEDSDAAGGPKVNGFLDDEAEEYSADEDEDDSE